MCPGHVGTRGLEGKHLVSPATCALPTVVTCFNASLLHPLRGGQAGIIPFTLQVRKPGFRDMCSRPLRGGQDLKTGRSGS